MSTVFESEGTSIGPQPGAQTLLLACTAQEIFFGGSLNSGKSYAAGLAVEAQHQRHGGHVSAIVFRKSIPALDDLIKKFKEILQPFGWQWRAGKKNFIHPDGAECRMRHLEGPEDVDQYWGHEYSLMIFDELGDVGEKLFEAIHKIRAARLRSAAGVPVQFIATGNPCGIGHKWCKERYIDPSPPFVPYRDPRSKHSIVFIPGRMEQNIKSLMNDPDYMDRCRSLGPDWYVKALIEGDWTQSVEGNMFHREWFNNRFDLRNPPNFLFKVSSWDTAFKTTKDSAESAETVWGVTQNGFYLLNAWSAKAEFPELKRKVEDSYSEHHPNFVWVEDKASGPSLVQSLKKDTRIPLKAIKVDGDKQRRAFVVTPHFESGKVFLPNSAPWLNKYIDQLCNFPAPTEFADLVDSTSQAITEIVKIKDRWERRQQKVIPLRGSVYGV